MTEEKTEKKSRRRPSAEAQAKASAAADKIREEQLKNAPPEPKSDSDDKISYDQWWMLISRKVTLRPHLKEIIRVDFKARGAGKMESEEKYNELLRVFGYKW